MKTHDDMSLPLGDNADNEFERTEGTVAKDDIFLLHVFEKLGRDPSIVFPEATGFKSFHAAVAEIDHANDAHDRKAAARFLSAGLRIGQLVVGSVHEGDSRAVDGLERVAPPAIPRSDAHLKNGSDPGIDLSKKAIVEAHAPLAIGAGIAGGDRQAESTAPGLHHGDSLGATGIGLQNLANPRPEDRKMTVEPLPLGGINFGEELRGQNL